MPIKWKKKIHIFRNSSHEATCGMSFLSQWEVTAWGSTEWKHKKRDWRKVWNHHYLIFTTLQSGDGMVFLNTLDTPMTCYKTCQWQWGRSFSLKSRDLRNEFVIWLNQSCGNVIKCLCCYSKKVAFIIHWYHQSMLDIISYVEFKQLYNCPFTYWM